MSELPAFLRDAPRRTARRPAAAVARPSEQDRRVPGEGGLWILLLGDMTVFALFFGAFLVARADDPAGFADAREHLTTSLGAVNTVALLTSSLFVARAVGRYRAEDGEAARRAITAAAGCAALFAALKVTEWALLLDARHTPASHDFFMFYFAITGVHLAHLLIGAGALALIDRLARRPVPGARDRLIVECAAGYWHMVDLLWIVIFPLLYLSAT